MGCHLHIHLLSLLQLSLLKLQQLHLLSLQQPPNTAYFRIATRLVPMLNIFKALPVVYLVVVKFLMYAELSRADFCKEITKVFTGDSRISASLSTTLKIEMT